MKQSELGMHLSKAPITEAIIEFGVVAKEGLSIGELESLATRFDDFRIAHPVFDMTGEITWDAQTGKTIESIKNSSQVGFRLVSPDGGKVVMLTLQSLSFHKLKPYSDWNSVFSQAWDLWLSYRSIVEPVAIRRLAARYINRMQLRMPSNLDEYLRQSTNVSDDYFVTGYLKRMALQDAKTGLQANMIEALDIPSSSEVVIILDNDVYTTRSNIVPSDDNGIRLVFGQIHDLKNKLFFETVTDHVVELYK